MRHANIILLQEHWLFQCQLYQLGEIHNDLCHVGKGVDKYEEIDQSKLPRGYGGVGIFWHKDLDQDVGMVEGGNERIQCIEINQASNKPILIICVYMPTSGGREKTIEYHETIDLLNEMLQRHHNTHYIVIGGDINEDLTSKTVNSRKKYILDFIDENNLIFTMDRKSFVNSKGQDCSEIDYFLVDTSYQNCSQKKTILDMPSNTSDHHPITITLKVSMENNKSNINQKPKTTIRVKWDKLDTDKYRDNTKLKMTENNKLLMGGNTEKSVKILTNILTESIAELIPERKICKNKPKLKVWNEEIKKALKDTRMAHKEWREAGKPNEGELIRTKKKCKSNLRKSVRVEQAIKSAKTKEDIMNARTGNTKLFHQLVNNERKCPNGTVELEVKDKMYYGPDQIVHGFREHFLELSTPKKNNNYDEQYHVLCRNEVQHIEEIVKNQETPSITVEELKKAMAVLNKGKSPDIFGITIEHLLNADEVILDFLLHMYNRMLNDGEVPNVIRKDYCPQFLRRKEVRR